MLLTQTALELGYSQTHKPIGIVRVKGGYGPNGYRGFEQAMLDMEAEAKARGIELILNIKFHMELEGCLGAKLIGTGDAYRLREPNLNVIDTTFCKTCKGRIQHNGQYWVHLDSHPRHRAAPGDSFELKLTKTPSLGVPIGSTNPTS